MNTGKLRLSTIAQLASVLSCPIATLQDIILNKEMHYGRFERPKKDGTTREINPPKPMLAGIQQTLKNTIQNQCDWTRAVHGGIPKRSIITNAKMHIGKQMVMNLDISKFFPSTTPAHVCEAMERMGCAREVAHVIAELTTYKGGLPQGSPTSTILGNLVLEPMDAKILTLTHRNGLVYSRYVDDLTLSGNTNLHPFRGPVIEIIKGANFQAHPDKIKIIPRSEPQIVTGLIVNDKLRPTTAFIHNLKTTIRRCWDDRSELEKVAAEENMSPQELLRSLLGRINHVRSVAPKLGREIRALYVRLPKN